MLALKLLALGLSAATVYIMFKTLAPVVAYHMHSIWSKICLGDTRMIRIICHGYKDSSDMTVPCGKALGEKEGGDGESHTYCEDCFQKQMDAYSEHLKAMESFAVSGTLDNGDSKQMKMLRVQAIALGKSAYESDG